MARGIQKLDTKHEIRNKKIVTRIFQLIQCRTVDTKPAACPNCYQRANKHEELYTVSVTTSSFCH